MYFDINKYKGKYAMHCKTKEEMISFDNYRYNINNASGDCWDVYKSETALGINDGCYCSVDFYKKHNYTILEWEDFMKNTFTKADLRTGDVVLRRDGDVEIVNGELKMFIRSDGNWNDFDNINNDLSSCAGKKYDIIAVRRPCAKSNCSFYAFEYDWGRPVYEEETVEEMTLAEVCKLLGKNIKIIK